MIPVNVAKNLHKLTITLTTTWI